ncbi:MAG: hypothetical protein A2W35_02595 [Chloroflexi bacterium RBG_16_57_11]|nr:MAG: hypothetical protein A2W35_02595 [Chloroflexi bacterium RBG_16_57_11]
MEDNLFQRTYILKVVSVTCMILIQVILNFNYNLMAWGWSFATNIVSFKFWIAETNIRPNHLFSFNYYNIGIRYFKSCC